jgi:hypothetical protein
VLQKSVPEKRWRPLFARVWNRQAELGLYLSRETTHGRRLARTGAERTEDKKLGVWADLKNYVREFMEGGASYPAAKHKTAERYMRANPLRSREAIEKAIDRATQDIRPQRSGWKTKK